MDGRPVERDANRVDEIRAQDHRLAAASSDCARLSMPPDAGERQQLLVCAYGAGALSKVAM